MDWDKDLAAIVERAKQAEAPVAAERTGPGLPPSGDPLRDNPDLADLHSGASNEGDNPARYGGLGRGPWYDV